MIRLFRLFLPAVLAVCAAAVPADATRYADLSKKFHSSPDQARVIGAGYLGAGGTAWLVSGGFQPDGTVVVTGVTLGPTFGLGRMPVTVLGKDGAAPKAPEMPVRLDKSGKPVLDRKTKKPIPEPLPWNHPSATAFVARMSSDLTSVRAVTRLPWLAGGVTSAAVDARGNIFLTGPAGSRIDALGKATALPAKDTGMKSGACEKIYVARLTPEADRVVWLRTLAGQSDAPSLHLSRSGKLQLQSADLRVLSLDGEQESVTVIPGGITTRQGSTQVRTTAVNPRDGSFVRAGEHHWPTGREPYRDPILNVHRPDGKLLYELYNWDGPLVGLDNLRLVSDSAIRRVRFDADGNLVIYAWSDGGNSVMYREPSDVRTVSKKMDGLGMSAWGAGVLSCAYILKIETKNYQVVGGTLWLAYLKDRDKPNSIWLDSLGFAGDGSVCFGGRSAYGLIQTGNAIGKAEPTGPYVAVLSKDCSSLRFCSVLTATGNVDLRDGERWGTVSGTLKGKPAVLFLGSAAEGAPSHGVGNKFGGGLSDGYMLLLDLSAPGK